MTVAEGPVPNARNRNYRKLHQQLIEVASDFILKSGADGVSLCALARATGINRSTVYYHFPSREALMSAAQQWSCEQQALRANVSVSRWVGIEHISGLFQRDADVITSWVNDHITVGDVRERYPQWDRLVARIAAAFAELSRDDLCDAEDYCALMLAGAFSTPRSFASPAHSLESLARIMEEMYVKALVHAAEIS